VPAKKDETRKPADIPEEDRDYYLERKYPSFGNLSPRDIASRSAKEACDSGRGVGPGGLGVYLDFSDAIERDGKNTIKEKYGNLFEMYERITAEDPYTVPMRIYPAVHYTMGGLWVDYNLQATIPGLHVAGEANFSDHGANRLGASALMQGLADGYFVLPQTIGNYLSELPAYRPNTTDEAFEVAENEQKKRLQALLDINGERSVDSFHKELGAIMWDYCGMARNKEGLQKALQLIPELEKEFYRNVRILGTGDQVNQELEKANRLTDFFGMAKLMCADALNREESCGGHFREEYQTDSGEAMRNDEDFCYVAVWEYQGQNKDPKLHKEDLRYENVKLATRSYK
jgi:succinate dehydrogenase / fumarate reductase flavoprotein subunit